MLLVAGARGGLIGGLPCLAGVTLGMASMIGMAVIGLARVVESMPQVTSILKWCGSAFLLWLALKVARAPPLQTEYGGDPLGFWKALAFQWINPKSWIVSLGAGATYGTGLAAGKFVQATTLAITFAVAAAMSGWIWLAFGASIKRLLTSERSSRAFNIAMALSLVASIWMVWR
jgi:threonine/homoserine/homoserine lactone efflux protein